MAGKKYWLFKSEPTEYSFADLLAEPDQTAEWDGVRNYQVRNMMRDEMKVGDEVLFYHSSTNPTAVTGTARIVKEAYPDDTAWTPGDKHFDPRSTPGHAFHISDKSLAVGGGVLEAFLHWHFGRSDDTVTEELGF